ncbi:hypothetical protein KDN24_10295 [Bacillus sp. Bva_UNVM-123]|uniref:hypothetical protein n=1 Tax=Bacillus sp. Bva_UNVM-123 TaxID=2829798 RepID=UPI00391F6CB4
MNNKIKSFEEFEQRFKKQAIPEMHSNEYLTAKIVKEKKRPIFLRASFITAFLTIFASVSIATAAIHFTGWKFFSSDGKQIFEMNEMTDEEAEPHHKYDEVMAKYRSVKDKISQDIPLGKFNYFLPVDAYEKIGVSALTALYSGKELKSVTEIPIDIKEFLHLKDELQNKLELQSGTMYYEVPTERDHLKLAEEMYKEAKEKNLEYITREGTLTADLSNLTLHYESESTKIEDRQSIHIIIQPIKEKLSTTDDLSIHTQITKDGIDFLYNKERHQIYFVKEDEFGKFLISISTSWWPDKFVESEEIEGLIEIAKTFLN